MNWIDPFGLYRSDVHLTLTYRLAIKAGFSPSDANIIARADQAVDDNIATSPYNPLSGGTMLHFMDKKYARSGIEQACQKHDLKHLGTFLHILQDTYSHYDSKWYYRWYLGGHMFFGTATDDFNPSSTRDQAMQNDTYMTLLY